MPQVGIRELKNETSEIIRAVREEQAEYIVTFHGQPVAVILPLDVAAHTEAQRHLIDTSRRDDDFWAKWDALAAEIDATWQSDKSAVELVAEQRREL